MDAPRQPLLVHEERDGAQLVVAEGAGHAGWMAQGPVAQVLELRHKLVHLARRIGYVKGVRLRKQTHAHELM